MLMDSTVKPSFRPVSKTGARLCAPFVTFCCHRPKADRARDSIPHQFDTLNSGFLGKNRDPGDVAAGMPEAIGVPT